jgi:hypothetical protein
VNELSDDLMSEGRNARSFTRIDRKPDTLGAARCPNIDREG